MNSVASPTELSAEKNRRSFTIGRLIAIGFGALVAATAVLGVVAVTSSNSIFAGTQSLHDRVLVRLGQTAHLSGEIGRTHAALAEYRDEIAKRAEWRTRIDTIDRSIEDTLKEIVDGARPSVVETGKLLGASYAEFESIRDEQVLSIGSGEISDAAWDAAGGALLAVDDALDKVVDAQEALGTSDLAAAKATRDSRITFTIIFVAVLTLLAALIAWLIGRRISRGVRRLVDVAGQLASGDLTVRADEARRDEFGALGRGFNTMAARLQETTAAERDRMERLERSVRAYSSVARDVATGDLRARITAEGDTELAELGVSINEMITGLSELSEQVQNAAQGLSSSSNQILAVVSQHNAATSEQSASIAQTSVTVTEVRATAEQTSHQVSALAGSAADALKVGEAGATAIVEIVGSMSRIRERVTGIADEVMALQERSSAIAALNETVTDLAEQSKMLALNATIEAARAGEHGKGFAVVAEAVRDLAAMSQRATEEVRTIIDEMQRRTATAVLATEDGTKAVNEGVERAQAAGTVIDQMADTIRETAQVASVIAASVREQFTGIDQIAQAIGEVEVTTSQIAFGAGESQAAAESLTQLAHELQQRIQRYQLQSVEPTGARV